MTGCHATRMGTTLSANRRNAECGKYSKWQTGLRLGLGFNTEHTVLVTRQHYSTGFAPYTSLLKTSLDRNPVNSSHNQLITWSCRHIVLVKSSYGQLVRGNSPQGDTHDQIDLTFSL